MSEPYPAANGPGNAAAQSQSHANRLTIAHLLLWTAGTAVALVIFPTDWLPISKVAANRSAFLRQLALRENTEKAVKAVVAPLFGTAIASLPLAGQRLLERRGGFPTQPGHWLLILLGLLYLLFALLARFQADAIHPPGSVVAFLLVIALLAASISAVINVRSPAAWQLAFRAALFASAYLVVACIVSLWYRGSFLMFIASGILFIAAGSIGLVAILRDLYRRARYDLFHWVGASVLAGTFMAPLLAYSVARFML